MPLDQETIAKHLESLAAHRRIMAHLLLRAAHYGGELFAPLETVKGIMETRAEIARIKAALREAGVQVEEAPYDSPPPLSTSADLVGGDKVGADKIGGDKVLGDQWNINYYQPRSTAGNSATGARCSPR